MNEMLAGVLFQRASVPGHLGQHSPGGVYESEQFRGGQGLRSHLTLPYWGGGKAVSYECEGEQEWVESVQTKARSPDRCRLGKAGQGSQTSGRWHRCDGCRCNFHTMHNRNLRAVKKQRDDITHAA